MYIPLELQPGIQKEVTPYAVGAGYTDGNLVRFWFGYPQAVGGWVNVSPVQPKFDGDARNLFVFTDLIGNVNVAIATTEKVYIHANDQFNDITPIRQTTHSTNPISTQIGLSTVTITDPGHGATDQNWVIISNAGTVGGVSLKGLYQLTYIDPDSYSVQASAPALQTSTGGGTVQFDYYLINGDTTPTNTNVVGYGAVGYSAGGYSNQTQLTNSPRVWSLDNFGQNLLLTPRGGPLYVWDASMGVSNNRATLVEGSNVPSAINITLATAERNVIAFGTNQINTPVINPMYVRWSDTEDYTNWTPDITNTAGGQALTGGSQIIGAIRTRDEVLVLTDTDAISMHYVGYPFIYGFSSLGTECGLISQHGVTEFNGNVYWMGRDRFFTYSGRVDEIPCSVKRYVFDDFNWDNRDISHAGLVRDFSEIWFFYPSKNSLVCDRYVSYNTLNRTWAIGQLHRDAYIDGGPLGSPLATADGILYYQENGFKADGSPIDCWVTTGEVGLGSGDKFLFTDRIIPDFQFEDPSLYVDMKMDFKRFNASVPNEKGPYRVNSTTERIDMRGRGRQVSFTVRGTGGWRMGKVRVRSQPDGER